MLGKLLGLILTHGNMPERLLEIAKRDPDTPIMSAVNEGAIYMERYWLFNRITGYDRKYRFIPFSIRIHVINEPDSDRHYHDHPFNAISWVLRGGYTETRLEPQYPDFERLPAAEYMDDKEIMVAVTRNVYPGDCITLGYDRYHRITALHEKRSISFFAFGVYKGQWGFLVDGSKVPHKRYRVLTRREKASQ